MGLARSIRAKPVYSPRIADTSIVVALIADRGEATFPHNLALISVLYSCERLDMTSHEGRPTKATTRKKKYESKNVETKMRHRFGRGCRFNRCVFLRFGSSARTNHARRQNHPRRVANDGYAS
jgi:hypothetical protein